MIYGFMALFAALIVAADQVTKYLVAANIPLYTRVPAIPGLIHWTYVQNTSAAFSSFEGMRLGYVVDMIETDFISFPVFNVADCFITCGCAALLIHLIFFNKNFWKDAKA